MEHCEISFIQGICPPGAAAWGGWVRSGSLLPVQRLLCFNKHRGFFCSGAVGVLGFYQKFLFLIRLFSILKASDPFMAQGGKPEQSLTLPRGGSCFCPEVQGATVSPQHSWDEKINSSQPLAHPQGSLVGRV